MMPNFTVHFIRLLIFTGLLACLCFNTGCDSQSGNEVIRLVGVDYTGVYTGTGTNLVSQNSGEPINTLNLSQAGSGLEAFDNNGNIWRGNLSRVNSDSSASFRLDGQTSNGVQAQMVGELTGEDTTGSMTGTYIEPGLFGVISATATIAEVQTNAAPVAAGLAITPTGNQTLTAGQTTQFTANGGDGNVQWSVSNAGIGQLSNTTGTTTTYTAIGAGTQTLTATSDGDTETVTITQTGTTIGGGFGDFGDGFGF